jgi:hypothetical protein
MQGPAPDDLLDSLLALVDDESLQQKQEHQATRILDDLIRQEKSQFYDQLKNHLYSNKIKYS